MKVRKLFKDSAVIFVFGVIISVAVQIAIEVPSTRYFIPFFIFASLFVVYAVITMEFTRKEINTQLEQIGLTSMWIYEPAEVKSSYKKAQEIICAAKHRVIIISHYFPSETPYAPPQSRTDYLSKGLEGVIRVHLNDPSSPNFTYKRIIQSSKGDSSNPVLQESQLEGDKQIFDHCGRVYDMLKGQLNNNVNVEFLVSEPIPSFPSLMIVDDLYVLFALTMKPDKLATSEGKFVFAGALFIEDRNGEVVQGFENIFSKIEQSSYSINAVAN